ncbi:hypothetical protein ACFOWM_05760 [Ferruginibacter yonginensis]|uniref:DUF202 domain-containing protein n=1 Tax=Ferruginibacter yonginensis TaxID=1310416 RepID=A0ABV8QRI5_9BACT
MALEEFEPNELSDREKAIVRMRSLTNYVMGILLIGAGCFFLFPIKSTEKFINQYDPTMITVFGVVCCIYGLFRIFRGYKKNYFREY